MKKTCEILKELREDVDLNQTQLAKEFNISRSAIASYENGNTIPSVDVLVKYAEKFNTSVDYLLGRVKEKNWNITKDEDLEITYTNDVTISLNSFNKIKELLNELEQNGQLNNKK